MLIRQQQHYSLISVLNNLGESINRGHYACNSLINDTWHEMNDIEYKACLRHDESTTCCITL